VEGSLRSHWIRQHHVGADIIRPPNPSKKRKEFSTMATEKLYYADPFLKEFTATVENGEISLDITLDPHAVVFYEITQ
jgi:hypothetical protein